MIDVEILLILRARKNHQIYEDVEFANKYSFLSNQFNDTYDVFDGDDAIEVELNH